MLKLLKVKTWWAVNEGEIEARHDIAEIVMHFQTNLKSQSNERVFFFITYNKLLHCFLCTAVCTISFHHNKDASTLFSRPRLANKYSNTSLDDVTYML